MSNRGRPQGKFTQHRRMDRLREILLRHPKGITLYELAEGLEVTPRTMRRYLKEVEREFDLESTETRGGGALLWRIRSGELPRKVELRRTQAYAFLAARRLFAPMEGSNLYEEISMATDKLLAISKRPGRGPNAGRADARLEERFLYLPFAPKNYAEKTEELDDLFQAVADLRPLTLHYKSASKAREEKITILPYAMVLHRDSIYCVGYHQDRGEMRTFVLDRMRDTQIHYTETFDLPDSFDIDEYFQGELGVFKSDERHKVVVDFDARASEYVRMRKVHPTQKLTNLPGGGVRLSMTVGNLNPVTSWVLEWGARARVVEPAELVERVQAELSEALAGYKKKATRK
ncbi:MAG TPA: WYL domain-containing transcriptional regulator [Polyangiaceae bacterium]|nr:WYL domain-containing transcriptional regulator [Polyangiaceae bacterium]